MLPLLEELAEELSGKADIVKFNCNAKNKELGKTLNVKVAPTFHLYKNNNKVRPSSDCASRHIFGANPELLGQARTE